jgi:hypothetical protein
MELIDLFTLSILIGGLIAIFRFQKIRKEFYPFIYLVWTACLNEIVSFVLIRTGHYNIISNNVYSLIEGLLLLWFFKTMKLFQRHKMFFPILVLVFVVAWVSDNFIFHRFGTTFNSYYNIICSFILVLSAITAVNNIIMKEREILMNPFFLICVAIVIFFTYMILVEAFWLYGLTASQTFSSKVFDILSWINLLCNLIYALAILWMQKKQPFTLQF